MYIRNNSTGSNRGRLSPHRRLSARGEDAASSKLEDPPTVRLSPWDHLHQLGPRVGKRGASTHLSATSRPSLDTPAFRSTAWQQTARLTKLVYSQPTKQDSGNSGVRPKPMLLFRVNSSRTTGSLRTYRDLTVVLQDGDQIIPNDA